MALFNRYDRLFDLFAIKRILKHGVSSNEVTKKISHLVLG